MIQVNDKEAIMRRRTFVSHEDSIGNRCCLPLLGGCTLGT
jgi:hypothetical protein